MISTDPEIDTDTKTRCDTDAQKTNPGAPAGLCCADAGSQPAHPLLASGHLQGPGRLAWLRHRQKQGSRRACNPIQIPVRHTFFSVCDGERGGIIDDV